MLAKLTKTLYYALVHFSTKGSGMYNLTMQSRNAVRAMLDQIDKAEIKRSHGRLRTKAPLDLSLEDDHGRLYTVHLPANSELCFWHREGSNYGRMTKDASFSEERCVIFAPDSTFQLKCESNKFVFQWLANQPLTEVGRTPTRMSVARA